MHVNTGKLYISGTATEQEFLIWYNLTFKHGKCNWGHGERIIKVAKILNKQMQGILDVQNIFE